MEFNVMQIDSYRDYLETFITDLPVKTTHNFEYCTSRLMKGMMDFFHNQVVRRYDHQAHLAIRFSRPLMRRAHRENLLKEGKFFTPVRNITSDKDLQLFKRHAGMPERIEAKRSNSMQLYTSFDTGCVRHHFYNSAANLPDYKNQMDKSKYDDPPDFTMCHNFFFFYFQFYNIPSGMLRTRTSQLRRSSLQMRMISQTQNSSLSQQPLTLHQKVAFDVYRRVLPKLK